ncbi:hypothetical protein HY404_04185 [Candidatus Microgenomates bacterium]|nr:hypothetical protein [Candidatus Microgenomates bacterium]
MPSNALPFLLQVKHYPKKTKILLRLFGQKFYTSEVPILPEILKNTLPTIFKAQCFNEQKLPFHKEVQNTELGHLFEHILLEYLCDLKFSKGKDYVSFSGHTDWNWQRDPRGTFHITVSSRAHEADLFQTALSKSTLLFNRLLA